MGNVIPVQAPCGLAEIIAHYGDPRIVKSADGWTVDAAWEAASCSSIQHGLLPRGKLYCHNLVQQPLLQLLDRWSGRIQAGDPFQVKTLGCFSPRAQRGSSGLVPSTHTWAIAFDLNADDNPLIIGIQPDDPRRKTAKTIPDAWISDALEIGWFWGGTFRNRFDPQHFQMASGM
jgi:hypothetical protein